MFSKSVLITLVISSCLLKVVPAQWDAYTYTNHTGLTDMKFSGNAKLCKSHCYEVDQLFNSCTIATTEVIGLINRPSYLECFRNTNSKKADVKDNSYYGYRNSYFLKDDCRGKSGYQVSTTQYSNLKEWTNYRVNEKLCRFLCLEIEDCFHLSFKDGKCYLQLPNITLVEGPSANGTVYKMKDSCKAVSCWLNHLGKGEGTYKYMAEETVYSNYECRMKCMQSWGCSSYQWGHNINTCYTHNWKYNTFTATFKGVSWGRYTLKKECLRGASK